MPPKRKSATSSAAAESSTAASGSSSKKKAKTSTSANAKASTTRSSSSKAKGKSRAVEVSSDDEEEDESVQVLSSSEEEVAAPAPKKRKKQGIPPPATAAAKAASTSKKTTSKTSPSKATTKATKTSKSKAKANAPLDEPLPDAPPPSPKKKKQPALPPWEEALPVWFQAFAEEDDEKKMGGEGIEKLFEQMDVSMEGVLPFLLAWKVGAKPGTFGSYYLQDFLSTSELREQKVASTPALKTYLTSAEKALYANTTKSKTANNGDQQQQQFRDFYMFLFGFLKEEGQKSLAGEMAVAVWGIVLAPKFALAQEFVEYAQSLGTSFKGVSSDIWTQLLMFCQSVGDDMEGHSEEDAWPTVIDSFAEWKREKIKNKGAEGGIEATTAST